MNGAIVINKEKNMTSRDVVNRLNKILKTKAIGHIGTLDPLATGVLVCLIGKYTKLTNILVNHDKEYIASFKLGLLTDTLDITGNIIKEEEYNLNKDLLEETLKKLTTTYMQEVPIYSAVRVNGKRLYEYARNNEEVILPKKEVTIYSLELIKIDNDIITIKTKVSKGTYIRALINDIGRELNTYGTLISLERTCLDKFKLSDAYTLLDIEKGNYKLLKIEDLLDCKVIDIDDELLFKVKNGQRLKMNDDHVLFKYNSLSVALYQKCSSNEIKPLIIF